MNVLRNGKVVIRDLKHGGLYELVGTVETTSTIISASASISDM